MFGSAKNKWRSITISPWHSASPNLTNRKKPAPRWQKYCIQPSASLEWVQKTVPYANPADLERFVAGLRKAGLK